MANPSSSSLFFSLFACASFVWVFTAVTSSGSRKLPLNASLSLDHSSLMVLFFRNTGISKGRAVAGTRIALGWEKTTGFLRPVRSRRNKKKQFDSGRPQEEVIKS